MPVYPYQCQNPVCEHKWETEQRIIEDPLTVCVECKEPTAKRMIARSGGFVLKGGGWYADLYS